MAISCGVAGVCAALFGCDHAAALQEAPPAPKVTVAKPVTRSVTEWDEFSGRLEAVEFVEVRARVGGLIMAMPFQEGALVKAGDVLAEIDERPYRAALDAAGADKAETAAQVRLAEIEYRRVETVPESARAFTELDNADANRERARALLAAADAKVDAARLDLEWCRVIAPISGRISRRYVTPGNIISGGNGQSTLLTTITSVDPIYCTIDADERSILKYARLAASGQRVSARQARIPFFMSLTDERPFAHLGEVDFVDNRMDPGTGTIRGRGVLPNHDGSLLPGLFARVQIPGSGKYQTLLVPDGALVSDQNERILLVVDEKNVVQRRGVKLGAQFGELRAIAAGISADDRVIINGLMQARPGTTVSPTEGTFPVESLPPDAPPINGAGAAASQTSVSEAASDSHGGRP